MAATLPRIGWRSLPFLERNHLRASTEATGFPVTNAADWRDALVWKPTLVATPPATEYIYCYPLTQTNLIPISNWYFRDWSAGASAAPDNWVLIGAGGSVARDATNQKIDLYAAALTRAGSDTKLRYTVPNYTQYLGRQLTMGAWIRQGAANTSICAIHWGTGVLGSAAPSGVGAYEFETVTKVIPYNATGLFLELYVNNTDTTSQFDGICLYYGATAAETPHAQPVDFLAFLNHNAAAGWTFDLESTTTPADWSAPTSHVSVAPTTNLCHWRTFTQASKRAWRLKCTPGTGAPQLYLGEVAWGDYFELPNYDEGAMGILDRKMHAELSATRGGRLLGRSVARETKRFQITQNLPDRAGSVQDEFKAWWEHAGGTNGRPFFYAWNQGDYPNEAVYAWLDDEAEFKAPHKPGGLIESLHFDCNALAEF